MSINVIVAIDENNGIGMNNSLPWVCKEDMSYFRHMTRNHSVVMGRKTFDSIKHALKDRKNYILTRNTSYKIDDCNVVIINKVDDLIEKYLKSNEQLYVIGGSEVYKLFIDYISYIDTFHITEIKGIYNCDTHFPISINELINKKGFHTKDIKKLSDNANVIILKNSFISN